MSRIFKHDGGGKPANKKSLTMLVSLMLVLLVGVGGTLAYLVTSTDSVVNTFTPSTIGTDIYEEFDGNTKSNVIIKNTGTTSAYVRAAIVITWVDKDGNVYPEAPKAGDYTLSINTTDWTEQGGYYYYKSAIGGGVETSALINSITPVKSETPAGYYLSVEVLAQAIQSEPNDAVEEAWGFVPGGTN